MDDAKKITQEPRIDGQIIDKALARKEGCSIYVISIGTVEVYIGQREETKTQIARKIEGHRFYPETSREQIVEALKKNDWVISYAAKEMGMSRWCLQNRLREFGGVKELRLNENKRE